MGLASGKNVSALLAFVAIAVPACKRSGPNTSQEKFAVLDSIRDRSPSKIQFLIDTIKSEDRWIIDYSFIDGQCETEMKTKESELKNAISYALQLWLSPIGERAKELEGEEPNFLPNGFTYRKLSAFYEHQGMVGMDSDHTQEIPNASAHLMVIFYCEKGASSTYVSSYYASIPVIHLKYRWSNNHIYISGTRYSKDVLVHEVGHAFGLDDTYPLSSQQIEEGAET